MQSSFTKISRAVVLSIVPVFSSADSNTEGSDIRSDPMIKYNTDFELSMGYRNDKLRFGTTFSDGLEDINSRVEWRGLGIFEIEGVIKYESESHFYWRGFADYGVIFSGTNYNTESIKIGEVTTPVASYEAAGRGGSVFGFSTGFGYTIKRGEKKRLSIVPLAGFAYDVQLLHMKHGKQKIESEDFDCGCVSVGVLQQLRSRFAARWYGPWLGIDMYYNLSRWMVLAKAEYHWAWFRGRAHWNLRTDFIKDSKQHSFGNGQVYTLGSKYAVSNHWLLGLQLGYQTFKTNSGRAFLYFEDETAKLKLNPVHWKSFNVLASVTYDL